ncbi:outer membrane protein assembly factor BamB [Parahaliea mediterranea]|uniref:Outer membrane protein assembly factor BamB n=2 Tax=Parahaliea mediterranea TaxID=651086 RepID=A0A939DDC2_9GAMM|nr:outer membrane protein assembly factor BamB [Parahaliea mediterranea]
MRRELRWLGAASLVMSLSACSTVKGWFEMDDDEDPNQPAELQDIKETVDIDRLWSTGIGDGQGEGLYHIQPALLGERIYAASADGEVVALDRERGKKIWDVELEDQALSGGVGAYEDSLFLGGADGSVLRLDAGDGSVVWKRKVTGEVLAPPQGDGDVVVAQTYDGKLFGLDYDTGERLWTYDSNVPVLTIRGTSTPVLNDGMVYAGFANGRVLAFTADTGAIAWEVRVAISQGRSEIERIVDIDGTMALTGNELYAAAYQGRIAAIEVNSGRKLWQQNVSSFSGVSTGFGNVYVADEDGTLTAYLRGGQGVRWTQGDLAYRELSRPTPVSSYVAVADLEGIVHIISQVDGSFAGRVKVDGDGARADMLSDGNVLYVYGNSGKLAAYEIKALDE